MKKSKSLLTKNQKTILIISQILEALCCLWAVIFMSTNMRLLDFLFGFLDGVFSTEIFMKISNFLNGSGLFIVYILNIFQACYSGYLVYYLMYNSISESNYKKILDPGVGFNLPVIIPDIVYNIFYSSVSKKVERKNEKSEKVKAKEKTDFLASLPQEPVYSRREQIFAIIYIAWYFICQFPLLDLIFTYVPDNPSDALMYCIMIGTDVILIIPALIIFWKQLFPGAKHLFTHFKSYMEIFGPSFLKSVICMAVVNIFLFLIFNSKSANQSTLEGGDIPMLYVALNAIIMAPIVEEGVFRNSLSRLIKNDTVFIIVSAATFGLLHTFNSEPDLLRVILYAIPYAFLGFGLARARRQSHNPALNIFFHFAWNALGIIVMLISLIFA